MQLNADQKSLTRKCRPVAGAGGGQQLWRDPRRHPVRPVPMHYARIPMPAAASWLCAACKHRVILPNEKMDNSHDG